MNNVNLIGRLTKDVELRQTNSGEAVGQFTLAVNRTYTNQQGEREVDFINCVIWRKSAENLARYTSKGAQVGIEGRLQTRNYENQQGQRVYVTEVVVNNFTLIGSANGSQNQNNGVNQAFNQQGNVNGQFNQNNANNGNFDGFKGTFNIEADDLPF